MAFSVRTRLIVELSSLRCPGLVFFVSDFYLEKGDGNKEIRAVSAVWKASQQTQV